MDKPATWNPLTDWKHTDIKWIKVDISKEDLRRFTKRSDLKGLLQSVGFLLVFVVTGGLACFSFSVRNWVLFALSLYLHGTLYGFFGDALHELSHNTVFKRRFLNVFATGLFGWLYWPWNPQFYRLSHQNFHHRYTLYQGSDGEDTPGYVELNARTVIDQFFHVLHIRSFIENLARIFTLKPTCTPGSLATI